MKTKIIFALVCLALSMNLSSQSLHSSSFETFKSYFSNNSNDNSNEIPIDLSRQILGDEIVNDNVTTVFAIELLKLNKSNTFLVETMYPEGGYSSSYHLICLSSSNKLLKSQAIGFNMIDADGGERCEINVINDSLVEVKQISVQVDEDGEEKEKEKEKEIKYLLIKATGFTFVKVSNPSKERLYPQASKRILSLTELSDFKKSDLDIMRNEIFADYSYIFKSDKWKKHFESQSWYKPRFNDVTDKLTIIEKVNIENILKTAPLK